MSLKTDLKPLYVPEGVLGVPGSGLFLDPGVPVVTAGERLDRCSALFEPSARLFGGVFPPVLVGVIVGASCPGAVMATFC